MDQMRRGERQRDDDGAGRDRRGEAPQREAPPGRRDAGGREHADQDEEQRARPGPAVSGGGRIRVRVRRRGERGKTQQGERDGPAHAVMLASAGAMSKPALRAILFDAGNTLIRMDYAAIAQRLGAHGVTVTAAAVQRAEWRARARLDADLLAGLRAPVSTESAATADRYTRYLLEALGVVDPATVDALAAWRRAYNPPVGLWTRPEPRAARALARTRAAGLRAAVVSNSNGTVRAILDLLGLGRHLDFVIDSGEVGVEKPDAAIFRLALARAGVTAAEAVYVGDLYAVDVLGARAAGIAAILVDPGSRRRERDCPRAGDVDGAVRLALAMAGYSGSVTNG